MIVRTAEMNIKSPTKLLSQDGFLLFATRSSRMFAYGLLSVFLVIYLAEIGPQEWEIGLLLTLTLVGTQPSHCCSLQRPIDSGDDKP
jgi:hypothetical protein